MAKLELTPAAKAVPLVQCTIDEVAGVLHIDTLGCPRITIDPDSRPEALNKYAALHGYKQRYVDAAALGAGATPEQKYRAMKALADYHDAAGEWSRVGNGEGSVVVGLLAQAIVQFDGCTLADAKALVGVMDKKTQAQMRASAELAPIIEALKTARKPQANALADVGGVLAKLRAMKPSVER